MSVPPLSPRRSARAAPPGHARPATPPRAATRASSPRGFSVRHRTGRWRDALRRRLLATADVATVLVACAIAGVFTDSPLLGVAIVPGWVLGAKLHGLYDHDHRRARHTTTDELGDLVAWAATGSLLTIAASRLAGAVAIDAGQVLTLAVAAALLSPLLRASARRAWRALVPAECVLVLGTGPLADGTRDKVRAVPELHQALAPPAEELDLSRPATVAAVVAAQPQLDRLVIANETLDEELVAELAAVCRQRSLKLSVVPPAPSAFVSTARLSHIVDLPLVDCLTWDPSRSTLLLKRGVDVFGSAVALVLCAPLLLAIAVLVRATSPGPVLFRQERAGVEGRAFWMLKFRTMCADAEARLSEFVVIDELPEPMFKLVADPRVTRVGRWLRRTSLDELPQLWNVLRGDMSLVGPRPEQVDVVARYDEGDRVRLAVKPGLTGPMQVSGRGGLRFSERVALERDYVQTLSLGRDATILLRTIAAVAGGRGAT